MDKYRIYGHYHFQCWYWVITRRGRILDCYRFWPNAVEAIMKGTYEGYVY